MPGVRYGDFPHRRVDQGLHAKALQSEAGSTWSPDDKPPNRIGECRVLGCQPLLDELTWIVRISREKDIERRPVRELGEEVPRRTIRHLERNVWMPPVKGHADLVQGKLQIGCR